MVHECRNRLSPKKDRWSRKIFHRDCEREHSFVLRTVYSQRDYDSSSVTYPTLALVRSCTVGQVMSSVEYCCAYWFVTLPPFRSLLLTVNGREFQGIQCDNYKSKFTTVTNRPNENSSHQASFLITHIFRYYLLVWGAEEAKAQTRGTTLYLLLLLLIREEALQPQTGASHHNNNLDLKNDTLSLLVQERWAAKCRRRSCLSNTLDDEPLSSSA